MNHISNLNSYQYQQGINVSISGSRDVISQGDANTSSKMDTNYHLKAGDIIQGEIVDTDGSQVKLMLNEGTVLNARLEQEIQMLLGQKMIFSVRGGGDSQLSLSPLFENMAKQETGSTALKEANLVVNDNNLKLVSMLMQEGMSIDKGTLGQLAKQIGLYPDVPMEDLVQMNKLGLPVNESNITQYQQYLQNNHQLLQTISDVVEQLPDSYAQLVQQGDANGANQLLIQVLQVFEEEATVATDLKEVGEQLVADDSNIPATEVSRQIADGIEVDASSAHLSDLQDIVQNSSSEPIVSQQMTSDKNVVQQQVTTDFPEQVQLKEEQTERNSGVVNTKEIMQTEGTDQQGNITQNSVLSKPEMKELIHNLKTLGMDESVWKDIDSGKLSSTEILRNIRQQLQLNTVPNEIHTKQLLQSDSFKKLLQDAVSKQWLLKPQDLTEESGVARFYERLERQTRQLAEGMEQNHLEQTPFAKAVQNMHSNINFMNDMNHMFTYIQLPLKLSQGNANSELYVYTNKKSLAKKGGDVSALLHLDMDHIGMLDIYIVLQNSEKVSTNFKVQDEEILELFDAHMDELNRRLSEKGYRLSSNVQMNEVDHPVMQEILQDNKKNVPVAMYTFDARA